MLSFDSSLKKLKISDFLKIDQKCCTLFDLETIIMINTELQRHQKLAKDQTVNLRYITSNSDPFEGGKQAFV